MWCLAVILLGLTSAVCGQEEDRLVDTEYGQVQGHIVRNVDNGDFTTDVYSYLAVPYAKDTSGPRRFAKPEKPDPWGPDIFVADSLGEACPQRPGYLFAMTHPGWDFFGENCLHLNIYTPVDDGPHPVAVWLHGGAFTGGSNIQYPGHFLATRNVVTVIANYRVNDFGFAFTNSDACPGNFGLWDQNLALQFVRDNIANFGGDPGRVTLFGQSAGGASTGLHMVSPESQGLIQQAILESGNELSFWTVNWPESQPENYIWQIAEKLNCSEGRDDYEMIDCLRDLPFEAIRLAEFECTPGHFCQGMAPVIDGPGGFIPEDPRALRESGAIAQIPIIGGITKDDASYYTIGMIPEAIFGGFNRSEFQMYMRERLLSIWTPQFDNVTNENMFQAWDYNYSPWPYVEDEYANREAINQLLTDVAFGVGWDRLMVEHSKLAPTFGYVYNYRGRNVTQIFPEWMGVFHMGELPAVWGYPLLLINPEVRNDSLIFTDIVDWTDEDIRHSTYWQTLYANFAHNGDPTFTPVQDPIGGVTNWSPFSDEDRAFLYVSNVTIEMQKEWEQRDYAFWREYITYLTRDYDIPVTAKEDMPVSHPVDPEAHGLASDWLEEVMDVYFEYILQERFGS